MGQSLRFLVVDDFSTMRKIIKKSLSEMGFVDVQEAEDGLAAWEALEQAKAENNPFAVLVTDWNMPKMSGIELLKKCKSSAEFNKIQVVLVTAESEQAQIVEAIKAGCTDYIVKPFTNQNFQEKINKVLGKIAGKSA